MKQIILYDSATGNTEYLAKALSHALPNVPCGPVGSLDCSKAELVYLGFWTDKGTCSDRLRAVLPSLAGKQIFLFGTAVNWFQCQGQFFDSNRYKITTVTGEKSVSTAWPPY